jgi:hypothetical protein
MKRESLEEISGNLPDLDDSMRVALKQRNDLPPHLLASPIRIREREDADHEQHCDNDNRSEESDQAFLH